MQVYRFRSVSDRFLIGPAISSSGAGLPVDLGPWEPHQGSQMPEDSLGLRAGVIRLLQRDGVHVERCGITVIRSEPVP
jgi:hypothetical protein